MTDLEQKREEVAAEIQFLFQGRRPVEWSQDMKDLRLKQADSILELFRGYGRMIDEKRQYLTCSACAREVLCLGVHDCDRIELVKVFQPLFEEVK